MPRTEIQIIIAIIVFFKVRTSNTVIDQNFIYAGKQKSKRINSPILSPLSEPVFSSRNVQKKSCHLLDMKCKKDTANQI